MSYATQMHAAKAGVITPEMYAVAEYEHLDPQLICERVAQGSIAIPANRNHHKLSPRGVGQGLTTKVNVNLGISADANDYHCEMQKVKTALKFGADAIMDLSNYGKTSEFRTKLIETSPAMIGTVPLYDAVGMLDRDLEDITAQDFLDVVAHHAQEGVDFVTIHAGLNRASIAVYKNSGRVMDIVSRGGSLTYAWMEMTGNENPFFEYYDELLEILREHDVTISLGDALRPGCLADASDAGQIAELIEIGALTKRAWEKDVQVIVEGPGHMALNEIPANMQLQKSLCHNAPFYVLGPLVTDIAPGYDHITSAIGGTLAAMHGADFLCYVTPAEHLRLPSVEDVHEGVIAVSIAAHAADIAKGIPHARDWDDRMAHARHNLDWDAMLNEAIDPEKAQRYLSESVASEPGTCTMCGAMCSVRTMEKALKGEKVSLL